MHGSGAIAALDPVAVEEGAKVLAEGGNAIDAAVTCAFVQSVVSPQMCGIGGYLILTLLRSSDPSPISLDAPATAGSRATPTVWHDVPLLEKTREQWGYALVGKPNVIGYQSICTPGTVKGLASILKRWGTISWARAIAPAVRIAEEGFVVERHMAMSWKERGHSPGDTVLLDYVRSNAEARRIYLNADGSAHDSGETIRNPDQGRTLARLSSAGAEDFYQGELAQIMSRDLEAHGAFVTAKDLADYRLREPAPLTGTYRNYSIATSGAPHGGPTLLALLNILEGYDLKALGHNSAEYIYRVSMAMKAAFADRNQYLADPQFVDVPVDWMVSKQRAKEWQHLIDSNQVISIQNTSQPSKHTSHISVVDRDGNCVSLTHSLGASSGVITPGLGFMYNNSMINFDPSPGRPNSIQAGKGRLTGMAPTIVSDGTKPIAILGASGGNFIITSVAQVIVNLVDFGMPLPEALTTPRFECQTGSIFVQSRIPEYVCAQVRKRHPIMRLSDQYGGVGPIAAVVNAVSIDPVSGKVSGAGDITGGGTALLV
ncbi:MAG: gamma-glutamyltransferase [Chloroflexi bacterium]|nr:gamma-glutamyltransferase [Chloroflexota bacterium]